MAGTEVCVFWMAVVLMSSHVIALQVDMNNASLTSIPAGKPANLTELILSQNSLTMSDSDIEILRGYPGIRVLDLSYNHIQSLPEGAFASLMLLETLKLRGNELKTLHKDIFNGLIKLKSLDLEENPWNCSCSLTSLIKHLNESGVSTGRELFCYSPQKTAVLDGNSLCLNQVPTARTTLAVLTTEQSSSKGLVKHTGSHSWKFLLGVVALTLSTAIIVVCAVKSPSWYKLLFNYRHQRLREDAEPGELGGRFSTFSLDTQQTEGSAQELEDDGFIEDGYIEPGNDSRHADADPSREPDLFSGVRTSLD
ncbi:leucine-rich repeat-containing protein 19-like [Pimephales promelas]|uniref:leucine-rich repeat-containing protein 19-like n=1 Tax=Pimephales promelas TaxID=90988 RepID=UPI0019557317|nr:leucine-rich repeat-containing protein 19-like [Pimephales promelas]XP_039517519.1 leucine-rich repeat-containing protein 19-like [Pimephales promelas]